jgi:hypothetical protein
MALVDTISGGLTTSTTTHTVTMPSADVGDTIVVIFRKLNWDETTWPEGWVGVDGLVNSNAEVRTKVKQEGDPSSINVTFATASRAVHICYSFSGVTDLAAAQTTAPSSVTDAPPPSLTPGWGNVETFWITSISSSHIDTENYITPTNYTGRVSIARDTSNGSTHVQASSAHRILTAESEQPGVWDYSGPGLNRKSFTIAVLMSEGAATATITSTTKLTSGKSFTITGTDFAATGNVVLLSPTDDSTNVNAATQTVSTEGTTEIVINSASLPTGTSHADTVYLFVDNGEGYNATGYAVTVNHAPVISTGTVVDATASTLKVRFTTDTANGTAYWALYPNASPDPTTPAQIQGGTDGDNAATSVATGNFTVGASGVQTSAEITGLDPDTTYKSAVVHYGDATA